MFPGTRRKIPRLKRSTEPFIPRQAISIRRSNDKKKERFGELINNDYYVISCSTSFEKKILTRSESEDSLKTFGDVNQSPNKQYPKDYLNLFLLGDSDDGDTLALDCCTN